MMLGTGNQWIYTYLFSNGQQSSPPRKYHLRCEELKLWDATLCFLARSHYGSMQSNIELYTLDGKKIGSPLELKNDTAYVAVKPPDAFISAGYKKYLIKASRSWEKRQEKFISNCAISKTGDNKCIQDCTKECIVAPNLNEDVAENLCPNCEMSMVLKENNNIPENLCNKHDSKEIKKCNIKRNNSSCCKSNKKDQILFKKKDTHMINKNEVNTRIRQLATPNNSISHHVNKNRQCKTIQKTSTDNKKNPKINNEIEVGKISNGIVPAINNKDLKDDIKYKNNSNSSKSDIVSNMFKNRESETQSLFIDINQNLLELENKLDDIPECNRVNKKNEMITVTTNNNDNTTNLIEKKNQEQNTDFVDKEGKLNIFLNIHLKDCTTLVENKRFLNQCHSELRVLSHIASQVNIDVMLSKGERNLKNNVSQIKKPPECDSNNNEGIETTIDGNKVTVIRCKYDSKNNIKRYAKEHSNFIFLLPIERSNNDIKEMVDKKIQVPSALNNEEVRDKTEIQEDSTIQSNFVEECKIRKVSECSQNEEKRKNAPTIICNCHSDKFTQTD